ncbi:unnamed protein product [Effrenium voratum]|nr:unnamed protein product [Effrenium voratum]
MVRSLPSTLAGAIGVVKKGDVLEGEPRHGWLLLDYQFSIDRLENGEGRWVLMDGKDLGLGVLLRVQLPTPIVTKMYANALQLSFDRDVSAYQLEVEPEIGEKFDLRCCEGKSMLVHGLHSDCHVRLRYTLDKDIGPHGEWEAAETTFVPDWEDADGPCVDLLGNPRGHCKQCSCKCFALEEQVVSLNMDVGDSRCARCGCNVTAHVLWKPKSKEHEGKDVEPDQHMKAHESKTKAASKHEVAATVKPVENPLLEKAISLPKEIMLERWRPMDMDPGSQEWPRLSQDFTEVVTWSDLHSDMGKNMTHLKQLPACQDTVLLLAGDVASSLETIETSLRLLQDKFGAIFYVPGNHELWVTKKDGLSSVHKFLAILEICEKLGVHTRPAFINANCAVCPLFSWYKDNLVDGFSRGMADIPFDMQTQWPWDITGRGDTNDAQQPEIADFFASLNQRRLGCAPAAALAALRKAEEIAAEAKQAQLEGKPPPKQSKDSDGPFVITMSHFLPRQECYPGPRRLCGVMGCREIDQQVRSCGSRCHVFGHSHIMCDREVNGIRYVQHPLGYPNDYHRQSAPKSVWGSSKVRREEPLSKEHESTLAKSIAKAILDEIRISSAKCLDRPPGRWNSQDANEQCHGNIFDRKEEMKLRESMGYDSKKMQELWSSPPPVRELEVQLTHAQDDSQQLTLNIPNNLLVRQLKERIVEEVGRGHASKIILSTSGENALNDDVALSSLEREIQDGLIVMGIDMSKAKEVKLKLLHAASDTPQSLSLSVLDTNTMLEIRKKVMQRLGETSLSQCKLVKRLATGGFQGLADDERLNKRRELLFLGRNLTEDDKPPVSEKKAKPVAEDDKLSASEKKAKPVAEVAAPKSASKVSNIKAKLNPPPRASAAQPRELELQITHLLEADQQLRMGVSSDFLVRELKELIVAELGHGSPSSIILSSSGDDALRDELPLSSYERQIEGGLLIAGIELIPKKRKPQQVVLKLVHAANAGQSLSLTLDDSCSILQLRQEAMHRLNEKDLKNCKVVKRHGNGYASLPDGESLNGRTELLFLGRDLPSASGTTSNRNSDKELSLQELLKLLEDVYDAVRNETFQKSIERMKTEIRSNPSKARAMIGPIFASACSEPMRKRQLPVSKKGFDDLFARIWELRGRQDIVDSTREIEGLLGVEAGGWFGIDGSN